eukprot:13375238-Alexandrium_andersonii.AAC.1
MCGVRRESTYGARGAAQNWGGYYRDVHREMRFTQGMASSRVFFRKSWKVRFVIHGDDVAALGSDEAVDWYRKGIQARASTKVKGRARTQEGWREGDEGAQQGRDLDGRRHVV